MIDRRPDRYGQAVDMIPQMSAARCSQLLR